MGRTPSGTEETTAKRLNVSKKHLEQLRNATRDTQPEETCGLLFGHKNGDSLLVEEFKILPNVDHSIVRFTIDPMALYESLMNAEKRGLSLVAIFHSHPMGAFPSSTDKKFMRFWPVPWLILSTTNKKFGVFMMDEDECREIKMQVT